MTKKAVRLLRQMRGFFYCMKNTLIKVFRLQRVDSVADRVFTGNDRTDIMKKLEPSSHAFSCLLKVDKKRRAEGLRKKQEK